MPRIFISHSSVDRELAGLLVDLLRAALNLPAEAIRCTSVEGHKLAGGEHTDEAIRREIRESDAFIGLISAASIESAYVLFELGARWGMDSHLLPVLAPRANASLLRGPLSGINALSSSNAADLHQMVRELAKLLGLDHEPPDTYQRRLDQILSLAAQADGSTPAEDSVVETALIYETVSDDDYATAREIIEAHCEQKWPDDYAMKAYCIKRQEAALAKLKMGRPSNIPEEVFASIRAKCARKWPEDFAMRNYCEQRQIEAFRGLQSH